jgi:hypothetical protein
MPLNSYTSPVPASAGAGFVLGCDLRATALGDAFQRLGNRVSAGGVDRGFNLRALKHIGWLLALPSGRDNSARLEPSRGIFFGNR